MTSYFDVAKASEDSTDTWDEEKRKRVHKVAGKAKPSVDGEKEGIKIRHGDNEFASGIYWPTIVIGIIVFYFIHLMTCIHV